jgi:hypothetical protein
VELIILLVIVGVLVAAGMALFGRGRSDVRDEDTPDRTELTDTSVTPPAHPDRPVPGSAPDRARKGVRPEAGPAGVARRHR